MTAIRNRIASLRCILFIALQQKEQKAGQIIILYFSLTYRIHKRFIAAYRVPISGVVAIRYLAIAPAG
jgi:hypothetical protein